MGRGGRLHTGIPLSDRIWFLNQVYLKSDIKPIVFRVPLDRNHGNQVHKWLASLAVVDDTGLDLTAIMNCRTQAIDCLSIGESPF